MVTILKKYFKQKTVADMLIKEFSLNTLKQISAELKDRREIYEVAGRYYPGGAEALAQKMSHLLKFKYLSTVNSELAGLQTTLPLEELKSLGACPLIRNRAVIALVCVDPAILKTRYKLPNNFPLLIATWSEIKKYWASENSQLVSDPNYSTIDYHKILERIILIAKESKEKSFEISCKELLYKISNKSGNISAVIAKKTADFFSVEQECKFALESGEICFCEYLRDIKILKVSWSKDVGVAETVDANSATFRFRIMIVDDSSVFTQVLKRFLDEKNYLIQEYNHPDLALRHLRSGDLPHLLISDLNMPKLSGKDLLKQMREDKELTKLPVVVLTSEIDVEVRMNLIALGADAFISKSEDPRLLAVQIQALLERFYGDKGCLYAAV